MIPQHWRDAVILRVQATGVSQLVFEFHDSDGSVTDLPMRDDGQYPDTVAGDSVFAISLAGQKVARQVSDTVVHRRFVGYLKPMSGTAVLSRYNVFAGILSPEMPILPVTTLAADAQRTEVLLNLHDPQFFNDFDYDRVARRFYQLFPDDFDFLLFVYHPSHFLNRAYLAKRNDTGGIGVSPFNKLWNTGSARRLQGFVRFPNADFFDGASTGYSHELGHRWINYVPVWPLSIGSAHWPLSSLAFGTMGWSTPGGEGLRYNCKVVPTEYGVLLESRPMLEGPLFTDLDLYLMGMLPASEVGSHLVFNNQSDPLAQTCNRTYTGAMTTVTLSQITAVVGSRIPDVSASQKHFRVGTILVSRDGLLDQNAMSFYSFFAKRAEEPAAVLVHEGLLIEWANPFAVQTRGIGSLDTTLDGAGPLSFSRFAANFSPDELPGEDYPGVPQIVGLRNNSAGPVGLFRISATAGFEQSSDCGGTLAAGALCTITITAPAVALGHKEGVLKVESSAGAPLVLPMTAFGTDWFLDLARPARPLRTAAGPVLNTQPAAAESQTRASEASAPAITVFFSTPLGSDSPCRKQAKKEDELAGSEPASTRSVDCLDHRSTPQR